MSPEESSIGSDVKIQSRHLEFVKSVRFTGGSRIESVSWLTHYRLADGTLSLRSLIIGSQMEEMHTHRFQTRWQKE
jgi:hypothetical protein